MANDPVVGIDLGTTYSAVARVNAAGDVEMICNREGDATTPSIVLYSDGKFIVGKDAATHAIARPMDVAELVKLQMGQTEKNEELGTVEPVRILLGSESFTPEEISAEILRKLVNDASEALGTPIRRAVITVPAYFVDPQSAATRRAGELAGLEVLKLLPEPEAAAIHFSLRRLNDGECVLVCDLGGGTYDASILRMEGDELHAVKTRGSRSLGGRDWTQALADLLAERITEATGENPKDDLGLWQHLYGLAEEMKRSFSTLETGNLNWSQQGKPVQVTVTAEEFDAITKSLMDEVLNKTAEVVRDAKLEMKDLTHVLLVGGSSRLRKYSEEIARITGHQPRKTQNPDEAVARGAALVAHAFETGDADRKRGKISIAAKHGKLTWRPRTHHALGTLVVTNRQREATVEVLIPENSKIPISVDQTGYQIAGGRDSFQVPVAQIGESISETDGQPSLVVQEILGNYRFRPRQTSAQPIPVKLRLEYDADGIAVVRAFHAQTEEEFEGVREPYREGVAAGSEGSEPGTVVLCVDCSGSMCGSKIEEAKRILPVLAEKYASLGSAWKIAVVNFGGDLNIYPSQVLLGPSTDLDELRQSADRLSVGGGTPMDAGLQNIRSVLETAPGKRLAIILTDGAPNDRLNAEQTANSLKALNIKIATVPIGHDADRDFLAKIGDLESAVQVDGSGSGMADAVLDLLQKL